MPTTSKLNLRTGKPVWLAKRRPPVPRGLSRGRSFEADVLVIGAGISGALMADVLSEAGLSVILVDRRGATKGSSAASTALVQYELDEPLIRLARKVGTEKAIRHYRRSKLAVRALAERARASHLDADLAERETLYLAGDVLDARGLEKEAEARQQAGFDTAWLPRSELKRRYGLSRSAALLGLGNFSANPVKMTSGFLNAAIARGAKFLAPLKITELSETARDVVGRASDGSTFHVRHAIYATGYEMPVEISKKYHKLHSTWAIATRPQARKLWPTQCLIWEASSPYLYLRTTADGRILCGGADEQFQDEEARDVLLERKSRLLERKLAALFPSVDARAAFRWTGTFGSTPTGTPSIGFLPGRKRTLAVLGFGGNGFTFSMIAAQVIRGCILREQDSDSDLYVFPK